MRTSTFIKRCVFLLFAIAFLSTDFALGQKSDFSQKRKEFNTKMTQMMRTQKSSQRIAPITNNSKSTTRKGAYNMPLIVTESGAALYGNLIYSSVWNDLSSIGFYSIDPNTAEYNPVGVSKYLAGAGTVVDGIAYISYAKTFWGLVSELYTVKYDIESCSIIEMIELNPEDLTQYAVNMAYDYSNDIIYALTYTEDAGGFLLCEFDRESGTYTKLTNVYVSSDIYAMSFDDNGSLYVMCADGIVREFNISNGTAIREVCNTGFQPFYMQSACWSPTDGKILWAASNDSQSHIIAVDVTAGTSEILCSFTHYEEWTSLYTTDSMASEDAPATPTIQYAANAPGSLLGSITIESPTQNMGGQNLASTEITLVVELNNVEIYENLVTPGENVTLNNVTFTEGFNTIRSYAINDAGNGDIALLKIYAGHDTPLPVTDLEVSIDNNGKATISWTAPTEGANGGYVDLSSLTYKIERDGVTVATGITNNYYIDQLPDQIATYEWTVYAVANNKISEPASTGAILFGDALTLPYEQTFNNEESISLYTIVDANNDGSTWKYDASKTALTYRYNTSNNADDYAFTPPLILNNQSMIHVEVNACSYMTSYPEKIEITLGSTTNPNQQTVIIQATQLDSNVPQTLSAYFSVEESGEYFVGIHAVSAANSYYLLVKDIKIEEGPNPNAPCAVSDVTATPGNNGALTANISFKAPVKSLNGNNLTGNVTVTAYRNNVVVGSKTLAPGATSSITDNNAASGINNYVLITSNSAGEGDIYETSCYCGIDTPCHVNNFKFTTEADNHTSVMSWEAPSIGINGGYVNPEGLVYTIYVLSANGNYAEPIAETSELSYEIQVEDDALQVYSYYVSAKNSAGESDLFGGNVVLGNPYHLPFVEMIEGTALANSPWQLSNEDPDSYATWGLGATMEDYNLPEVVVAPDGGMAVCYDFYEVSGGLCSLISPKISLNGAESPTLYFSMYHYNTASNVNELSVLITTNDATYEEVFAKKVNATNSYGWADYEVSLNEYKDAAWIAVTFNAQISANGFVFLDNIIVENASENDILVESFTAPTRVTMGEEVDITATVYNKGSNAASYEVSFFIDDKKIASMTETGLESNESEEYTTTFIPTADNIGENIAKVVVTMNDATDEIMNNNSATIKITVSQPYLRVVTDLKATEEDGMATLTWSEPILAPLPTVDDFENYENFITDNIGGYTIVDADNAETYGIEGFNIPLPNGPKAWQVWNPTEVGITEETWQAHEGSKCLVAFSTISGAANDWLISPEIIGGTELSFWAAIPTKKYGAEKFEVLYSTTNTNISSFQLISQESKGTTDWEEFAYILPDDAKYFAIRYTSSCIFALLIDDLSFTEASSTIDISLIGYNIYCDGNKINDANVSETNYIYDLQGNLDCSFNVTVIYNEGESLFSNTAKLGNEGIDDMNVSFGIYPNPVDDRLYIETEVAAEAIMVYDVFGRLQDYKTTRLQETMTIDVSGLNAGVYFVKIITGNGKVVRRFVKR